jgi:glucose-6-phosphate 1-epimerase
VGSVLNVTLHVTNTSSETFDYSCALHSYFSLSSIDNLRIEGLQNTIYYNQLTGENGRQEEEILEIHEPLTRHYLDTESDVIIEDTVFRKKVRVAKAGSKVTTVWNPWEEASRSMADLPDDGYETFVCVETVNAFTDIISLGPGQSHEIVTMISRIQ